MRRYLSILEGPTPQAAVPVLFTEDTEIIEAVAEALAWRLQAEHGGPEKGRALRLLPEPAAPGSENRQQQGRDRGAPPQEHPSTTLQRSFDVRPAPEGSPVPLRVSDPRCAFCAKPFKPHSGGRPQRFCSNNGRCRWAWWAAANPRVRR